jgi:hypothetical protein
MASTGAHMMLSCCGQTDRRSGKQQCTENSESCFSHREHINPTSDKKSLHFSAHPPMASRIPDGSLARRTRGSTDSSAPSHRRSGTALGAVVGLFSECWRTSVLKKLHNICSKRLQGQKLSQGKLLQIERLDR